MVVRVSACWSCCSWGYWRTNHWLRSWQEGQLWVTSLQISNDLYIVYWLIASCLVQDSSVCPREGRLPDAKQGSLLALHPIIICVLFPVMAQFCWEFPCFIICFYRLLLHFLHLLPRKIALRYFGYMYSCKICSYIIFFCREMSIQDFLDVSSDLWLDVT